MPSNRCSADFTSCQTIIDSFIINKVLKQSSKQKLIISAVFVFEKELYFFGLDIVLIVYFKIIDPQVKAFERCREFMLFDQTFQKLVPYPQIQQILKKILQEIRNDVSSIFLHNLFIFLPIKTSLFWRSNLDFWLFFCLHLAYFCIWITSQCTCTFRRILIYICIGTLRTKGGKRENRQLIHIKWINQEISYSIYWSKEVLRNIVIVCYMHLEARVHIYE